MHRILLTVAASLLALSPLTALGGGYGPGAYGPGGRDAALVEVPCYPEDPFNLCPVPAPTGHGPDYLSPDVPTRARLATVDGGRFAIWVTPNAVADGDAVRQAARAAAAHCGLRGGPVVARIDTRERYAPEQLDAWKFAGSCR